MLSTVPTVLCYSGVSLLSAIDKNASTATFCVNWAKSNFVGLAFDGR
jgi:hypothetical protein